MRLRFSIRTLLVLTALAAACCYWWVARPTMVAQRFAVAVDRGDYKSAGAMCDNPKMLSFNVGAVQFNSQPRPPRHSPEGASGVPPDVESWVEVDVLPRTWTDLYRGERRVSLRGVYSDRRETFAPQPVVDANDEFDINAPMELVVSGRRVLIPLAK